MQAITVVPGRPGLELRHVPEPPTASGDALVRVVQAGLCGTDAEITAGLYGQAPPGSPYLVLGHENLGIVESAPSGSPLRMKSA